MSPPVERHFDVAILQPGYLPWLGYFDLVALSDVFVLYDDVQFDKGGWRNRNRILGATSEPLWLSVPVLTAGRLGQTIRDAAIKQGSWQAKHLRSIRQVYRRAPFFDWCFPAMERYLGGQSYHWLIDLCLDGHSVFVGLLDLPTKMCLASELGYTGIGKTERLVALCQALGATRYLATNASAAYMDQALWSPAGIVLTYQNYPHPTYQQFDATFTSHLSVIDALMFAGPKAKDFVGISHSKLRTV